MIKKDVLLREANVPDEAPDDESDLKFNSKQLIKLSQMILKIKSSYEKRPDKNISCCRLCVNKLLQDCSNNPLLALMDQKESVGMIEQLIELLVQQFDEGDRETIEIEILTYAIATYKKQIFEFCLAKVSKANIVIFSMLLKLAINISNTYVIKQLLTKNMSLQVIDVSSEGVRIPEAPLIYAIKNNYTLSSLAIINFAENTGELDMLKNLDPRLGLAPLHYAATLGRLEIASTLIKAGVAVDKKTESAEMTALQQSVELGLLDMVNVLLEAGADPRVTTQNRNTLLDLALKAHLDDLDPDAIADRMAFQVNVKEVPDYAGVLCVLFDKDAELSSPTLLSDVFAFLRKHEEDRSKVIKSFVDCYIRSKEGLATTYSDKVSGAVCLLLISPGPAALVSRFKTDDYWPQIQTCLLALREDFDCVEIQPIFDAIDSLSLKTAVDSKDYGKCGKLLSEFISGEESKGQSKSVDTRCFLTPISDELGFVNATQSLVVMLINTFCNNSLPSYLSMFLKDGKNVGILLQALGQMSEYFNASDKFRRIFSILAESVKKDYHLPDDNHVLLASLKKEVNGLEADLAAQSEGVEGFRQKHALSEQELALLKQNSSRQIAGLNQKLASLKKRSARQIASLTQELALAKKLCEEKQATIDELKQSQTSLRTSKTSMRDNNDKLKSERANLARARERNLARIADQQAEIAALIESYFQYQHQDAEISKLRGECAILKAQSASDKEQISKLSGECARIKAAGARDAEAKSDLKERCSSLEVSFDKLHCKVRDILKRKITNESNFISISDSRKLSNQFHGLISACDHLVDLKRMLGVNELKDDPQLVNKFKSVIVNAQTHEMVLCNPPWLHGWTCLQHIIDFISCSENSEQISVFNELVSFLQAVAENTNIDDGLKRCVDDVLEAFSSATVPAPTSGLQEHSVLRSRPHPEKLIDSAFSGGPCHAPV